ncbi:MAG: DNA mismatch repair protein MutS, partial [Halobacteriaceae archaeon]
MSESEGRDQILGAPPTIADRADELTPMLRQYFEVSRDYDDAIVLFQVGDFYEVFCETAEVVARVLEVTLTKREDSTGQYPMAGIPIDNAESYIQELLDAGYRVAVADQIEDPDEATGVVDRAVTRIITPGTITEDQLLSGEENNFVASLTGGLGLAFLDVSTGDFYVTSTETENSARDEIQRFDPAEAVLGPDADPAMLPSNCMITPLDQAFELERAREHVADYFGDPDRTLTSREEVRATGALLRYAEYTRGEGEQLEYLSHVTRYDHRDALRLDAVALDSLEIFDTRRPNHNEHHTLVNVVDETACALGRRRLNDWLRRPLTDETEIDRRLDAVSELRENPRVRDELQGLLRDVYDIERLITKISRGRANARELRSLHDTLATIPEIKALLSEAGGDLLADIQGRLDTLEDVRSLIGDAIREDPPTELTEGGVIKLDYDSTLEDLRTTEQEGKAWVDELEAQERKRTGIESLEVGHNTVHGYYIEVTKANLD